MAVICVRTDCVQNFQGECMQARKASIAIGNGKKCISYERSKYKKELTKRIESWEKCVSCGAQLLTESTRLICKECEEKSNESESSER